MNNRPTGKRQRKLHQLFADDIVKDDDLHSSLQPKRMHPDETHADKENCESEQDSVEHRVAARAATEKGDKRISGQVIKKTTIYDTWYVIRPKKCAAETREQRHCLQLPLVKLANASTHMQLPSGRWSSKVTLYKVMPLVLQRHTLTIFTGDLKPHQIPEKDRHKYQPSCVIFRRDASPKVTVGERSKCSVSYDRVIIFKHKYFTLNFDGKHVNLNGAPEAVTCIQDVHKLLDILDSISLSNSMIEIVQPK
ncbi:hypothetical protein KR222_001775 [Zaprionus bogoriensis]|nr:hypothetical protein KR222_001775 [Zaprionus bogoriensis]